MKDKGLEKMDILLDLISKENIRQIEKWGWQDHDMFKWYTIIGEEFGEIGKAMLEQNKSKIVKEAIQTATLALKIAEMNLNE